MVEAPSARRSPPCSFVLDQLEDGARDARHVEAAVLVEALVLGRKERRDDALRNRVDGHEDAPLARVLGDQRAVMRMDARHDRRLVLGEALVVGQVLRHAPQHEAGGCGADQEQDDERAKAEAEEAQEQALAPPLRLRGLLVVVGVWGLASASSARRRVRPWVLIRFLRCGNPRFKNGQYHGMWHHVVAPGSYGQH